MGAGIAGLTTALEAARGGANVAVVDIASVFGGHAVVSEGGLALIGTPLQQRLGVADSPDLAYQDFLRWGGDAKAEWVRLYVERSRRDIHDWMTEMGVSFEGLTLIAGNSAARFHTNPQRGYGLVEPIYRECLRTGRVRFHWNTRVTDLIRRGGRVTGIEAVNERTGAPFRLAAQAIVLATGGFQSNLELVRRNWPQEVPLPEKILIGSGTNAMGSGLELARKAGAAIERLDHQWNYPRGIPDPRYPGANRGLHVLSPGSIWVNAEGMRFTNETAGAGILLKKMLAQPGGRAWIVLDAAGRKSLTISGTAWIDPQSVDSQILNNPDLAHTAKTLEELATKAGWPVDQFLATIAKYNDDVRSGTDVLFGRFDPQHPPTARAGRPAIEPIAAAPFYAIPIYPMTRKSLGGVAVDLQCRVLNEQGTPIPNLYAAGEVTGFNGLNGKAGLEGTFLGPSILQGRILGQNLARLARNPALAEPTPAPGVSKHPPAATPAACQSCHPLKKLTAMPRKGYWHFEQVHKAVLDRGWECLTCHAELSPFDAKRHRTDSIAQIAACARCHLASE